MKATTDISRSKEINLNNYGIYHRYHGRINMQMPLVYFLVYWIIAESLQAKPMPVSSHK